MRTIDPALPRIGTDFMTLQVVMRTIDPALPRIGTDFMTLRAVIRTIDPALPRIGTDFMTLQVVMQLCGVLLEKEVKNVFRPVGDKAGHLCALNRY